MAGLFIPGCDIPGFWHIGVDIINIIHNETKLSIGIGGELTLIGNVRDAALGLIEYLNTTQNNGVSSIILNQSIEIDLENYQLLYCGKEPSQMTMDLIMEFNKAAKLKAFW